ncbi:TolC family protein [Croceiramulus getboli]|nr:TolC family protein [Flavobacteriaceae bacterium YJPT1-3]
MFSFSLLACHSLAAQELQSYIQEAELNNPEIQALEWKYQGTREKVNEAQALPNTSVSVGYFVSEPETRTGAQVARFSVSQMLPWFGTITAREQYANAMAETEFVALSIAKRKLALTVAQSYYELYALQAQEKVLQENIELLETYERLALTAVEVNKASVVDVLRLQIRQNELEQQRQVLLEDYKAEQIQFTNYLNRQEDQPINVVSELILPETDPLEGNDQLALHPELLQYDRLYESVEQSELVNQKEAAPSLGLGLDYVPVAERPNQSFSDNGKDIVMPMVSLSIPIFNSKYSAVTRQNELKLQEIQSQKTARLNVLESAFAKAKSQQNQARITYETQVKNSEKARDAEAILLKKYETASIDFNDLLDIQQILLSFQKQQIEALKKYYQQTAIINYLVR